MKTLGVLFLGGAKRVSIAECLINEGNKLGINIQLFSYELEKTVPVAINSEVIIGLKWNDPDIYNHLSEIVDKYNIKVVIPFVDPAISIACDLSTMNKSIFTPTSAKEICEIMFDKKLSEKWFVENNIPIPESFNEIDEIKKYPVIIKPRKGSASKGIQVIELKDELLKIKNLSSYVIQSYIANKEEYTVDCYVSQDGKVQCIVPRIRLEVAGGEAIKTITCKDPFITDLSKSVLEAGKFKGAVTIQYIKNLDTNEIFVMEINPRLGGAVIASIYAGANIPHFIIKEAVSESITQQDDWKDKTLMTRYFKEVIFYADNN